MLAWSPPLPNRGGSPVGGAGPERPKLAVWLEGVGSVKGER